MKRWIGRAAVAAVFAAMLALAAPAGASGWPAWAAPRSEVFQALRQWIVALWASPAGESLPARDLFKEGSGINPNGSPSKAGGGIDPSGLPSSAAPAFQSQSDAGSGINPDG